MLLQRPCRGFAVRGSCSIVGLHWWAGVCCVYLWWLPALGIACCYIPHHRVFVTRMQLTKTPHTHHTAPCATKAPAIDKAARHTRRCNRNLGILCGVVRQRRVSCLNIPSANMKVFFVHQLLRCRCRMRNQWRATAVMSSYLMDHEAAEHCRDVARVQSCVTKRSGC